MLVGSPGGDAMKRSQLFFYTFAVVAILAQTFCVGMFVGRETKPCKLQVGNQRLLSPHETQPEPTPALAPGRWIDERYEL